MSTVTGNSGNSLLNPPATGTAGAAGGLDTEIQYNSSGILTGDANLTWNAAGLLQVGYDISNYWTSTVGSTGGLALAGVGTGGTFSVTPTTGQNATFTLGTTGDFKVNATQLVVDTSAARVGINTATPNAPLDVIGAKVWIRGNFNSGK